MKFLYSILLATLCALSTEVSAEEHPLTLKEAIQLMLRQHPALEAATQGVAIARHERRAAKGLYAPEVVIEGGYSHLQRPIGLNLNGAKTPLKNLLSTSFTPAFEELLTPLLQSDWQLTLQQRNVAVAGIGVTVPLWMGGRIHAANRAAELQIELSQASRHAVQDRLYTELIVRYFGLALAQEATAVKSQALDVLQGHMRNAEQLEQEGMIARSERLYVAYRLSEAQRDYDSSLLQCATLSRALQTSLGIDSLNTSLRPITSLFVVDSLPSISYFTRCATANNPLLRRSELAVQLSREEVRAKRAAFFPEIVALGGGVVCDYQLSGMAPRWAVGISLRFMLFDGFRRNEQYRIAKLTTTRYETLECEAHEAMRALIEEYYNKLQAARDEFYTMQKSLDFAYAYLRDQRIAFCEGIISAIVLLDAELEYAAVRLKRLEAAYHFVVALAQLLEAVGVSDTIGTYLHSIFTQSVTFQIDQP